MFKEFYLELSALFNHFQSLALLSARLVVAYGFAEPTLLKWNNFEITVKWFATLGIPFPTFTTFLTASIETVALILLPLGFLVRFISVQLIVILTVAIFTVHSAHGFSVADNGFEIPLYYILFLAILLSHGAGRFSIDALLYKKERK